jgi:hypothetical protein
MCKSLYVFVGPSYYVNTCKLSSYRKKCLRRFFTWFISDKILCLTEIFVSRFLLPPKQPSGSISGTCPRGTVTLARCYNLDCTRLYLHPMQQWSETSYRASWATPSHIWCVLLQRQKKHSWVFVVNISYRYEILDNLRCMHVSNGYHGTLTAHKTM